MANKKTVQIQKYDFDNPTKLAQMANVLKSHVVRQKLYSDIKGKNYVHIEGWQFAGSLLGLSPRVVKTENLSSGSELKWMTTVEIVNTKTKEVMSTGFAICSSKEGSKKSFDEYAILSMSQTRAIGKAYRNLIGWVMKLAGYEGTPSEEMMKVGEKPKDPSEEPVIVIPTDYSCSRKGCGEEITKQQAEYTKRIYGRAFCKEHMREATPLKK